ncbi:MAG: HNH endonuclease [Smithellaceae bacterium]
MIDKKKYMEGLIDEYKKMIRCPHKDWKVMKSILGYRCQYKVCRNGLVYNRLKKKWLMPQQHKNGYLYVVLYLNGARKNVYLHRLVAEYFVRNPMPNRFAVVYNLDGDKRNNRANNIRWTSKSLIMREIDPSNTPRSETRY